MNIENTDQNQLTVSLALSHLSKAARAAATADYDYLLNDFHAVRGSILRGDLDTDALSDLMGAIYATKHERHAKKIRVAFADGINQLAKAGIDVHALR